MVFNARKSHISRFVLILALLASTLGFSSVEPASAALGDMLRVSVSSSGSQGNGTSGSSSISDDGRFVAFDSAATNLVTGDTNGQWDVFLYDRLTAETIRISVASSSVQGNGLSSDPSVSGDGHYVVFRSSASNLVSGDTNGTSDLFAYDIHTGMLKRVSVGLDGLQGNGNTGYHHLSKDGRYIVFSSTANNLVAGDTNGKLDVFLHDQQSFSTTRVSVDSNGTQANGDSEKPFISADGRYIVYHSSATNLVSDDTNALTDVFLYDRETGTTTRISINPSGLQGNGESFVPSISADGLTIAFGSAATNLVDVDTNARIDIFVHDRQTGVTTLASKDSNGVQSNASSYNPILSADGRFVTFNSAASNLVSEDTNGVGDVFLHDRLSNKTIRVSVSADGVQASGGSSDAPSITADGRLVAFDSSANNLVGGDTNAKIDVFVRATDPLLVSGPLLVTKTADTNDGICDSDCSLREAIANAVSGNTIQFAPSLAGQTIALTSQLDLQKDLVIDGSGLSPMVEISGNLTSGIFYIAFNNTVTLQSLVLKDGRNSTGGGAIYNDGNLRVLNSTFSNNSTTGSGGAIHNNGLLVNVRNSTFVNNSAQNGGAIYLYQSPFSNSVWADIVNNTFVGNQANIANGLGGAIYSAINTDFAPENNFVLANNTFSGNGAYSGGNLYNWGSLSFHNNIFTNSTSGGDCYSIGSISPIVVYGLNNLIEDGVPCSQGTFISGDPLLGPLAANGGPTMTMALLPGSPAIDAGTTCVFEDQRGVFRPQGNYCDIGAYEAKTSIRYVKWNATGANNGTSWTNAFTSLQAALTAASGGEEIWVAAGTYKPTTGMARSASFALKNGVRVYGGFNGSETQLTQRDPVTNLTILSGDIGTVANNADNSYHVVTSNNTDISTVLDGFTITAGNANGTNLMEWAGGGMYNVNSNASLANVTFTANAASSSGGGMHNSSSNLNLSNVTFNNNSVTEAGGGMYNLNSNPSLSNVTFSANSATDFGGGMYNNYSNPSLVNVTFSSNLGTDFGTGMANANSSPTLTNVTFSGNTANLWGGGMMNSHSSNPTLSNVTFSGNSATHGGGMYNSNNSTPKLKDVTLSNNSASFGGGGMYNSSNGNPTLTNVTFTGNTATYGAGMNNYLSSPSLIDVTFSGNVASSDGGAMYNNQSVSLTLSGVKFIENVSSQSRGGGIFNYATSPLLTNVTFSDNQARQGGGMYNSTGSNPSLSIVIFNGNSASSGSGMYNSGSNPSLEKVTFSNNTGTATSRGGAMVNDSNSSPSLLNVLFHNNLVTYTGGGMQNSGNSSPSLTNVTFSGNTAQQGGGIYNYSQSNPTLTNVTFKGNAATSYGGAIANDSSHPVIRNSILWGNAGGEIGNMNLSAPVVTYSIVQGGYSGTGNLNADPLLGPLQDNGSFTQTMALGFGSPAIDTGDDLTCPSTDQRGVTRPQWMHCDIGAYEYEFVSTSTAITSDSPDPSLAGQPVTVYVRVTGGSPTGTVSISDGDRNCQITLGSNGTGSCNIVLTSSGAKTLVAMYNGDVKHSPSSDEETHEVLQPTPTPTNTPTSTPTSTPTATNTPSYSYRPLYLSLTGNQTVGGIASADEDILKFDGTNWSLFFDGSDVGVGSPDLFAFSLLDADTLLMSFSANVTVQGISATPQDVLRFDSTSLGNTTAGTWSLYFDGSDVGLDSSADSIDSLTLLPDGRLLFSTTGNPTVPGLSGLADEDVLAFTPTSLGSITGGTWAIYFDGSDVGLAESSNEDIDALDVTSNGDVYLSTLGDVSVTGLSAADEDVFICVPSSIGSVSACSYVPTLYFDGSTWGLAGNDVDAFNFLALGSIPTSVPSSTPSITPTRTPSATPTANIASPSPSNTPTPSPSPTATSTRTPTTTPTTAFTPTGTSTPPSTMFVQILQPNGGEVLTVGTTYRITWNSSPDIDKVTLGYKSCESCLDWIATNIPNTGYYDWNVYVGNTTNTQFKIDITAYDTGVGSVIDRSDNNFTVLQPTPTPTRTVVPTATPSATPAASDVIFADGFESGDFSAWAASVTNNGNLSASSSAALMGSYGLQSTFTNTTAMYVRDDSPNAETRYRARFYFHPNSVSMSSGAYTYLLQGYDISNALILSVQFYRSSAGYQLRVRAYDRTLASWVNMPYVTISNALHSVELDWGNDGHVTFWVDGMQQGSLTGIQNSTYAIGSVRLGAPYGSGTMTGSYYLDGFESRRNTYIGP
jgi:CSLREA domain-containing protein